MWITSDGQWKAGKVYTSVNRRSVQKLRLWRWSEDKGDWEKVTDVNNPTQLGKYFSLASLYPFKEVPNTIPEGWL